MSIEFIGLEKLGEEEVDNVTTLSSQYFDKISRELKDCKLIIDVKIHSPEGKRKQYGFLAKVIFSGDVLTAEANDWDLRRTLHKVFNKLINEVKHKFKTEGMPKHRA